MNFSRIITILITVSLVSCFAYANRSNTPDVNKPDQPADANKPVEPNQVPDVNTIVTRANLTSYYQGDDGKARVKMTIIGEDGQERNREFNILRKDVKDGGNQLYYVYFHRPADVRKMVFIVHKKAGMDKDDDRWLYLPALDLVKRIAASDKRTSFVGSHYLYEDVSGRGLEEDHHELADITDKYFVVKNTPKEPNKVKFKYYNTYINRETYLPEKIEYYDKQQNKIYRTIEATEIKEIQGFVTPVKSVVTDKNMGGKTIMEYSNVQYNVGLNEDIFSERYLRRPPREVLR